MHFYVKRQWINKKNKKYLNLIYLKFANNGANRVGWISKPFLDVRSVVAWMEAISNVIFSILILLDEAWQRNLWIIHWANGQFYCTQIRPPRCKFHINHQLIIFFLLLSTWNETLNPAGFFAHVEYFDFFCSAQRAVAFCRCLSHLFPHRN